ncbi:hypothetical protein [Vibrio vulnificus]|uniref:hypothetical protein n=1 Tax=Vibrio vulnificus TaxID=672 RepID=UPI001EEB2658|nr:hypothetical protein [Vibrio vulnificus]MCG6288871.1 hypothetical protein [Vibrio vulnificus]
MNNRATWTLTATVTDAAGNSAVDDMPTLTFPDVVTVYEDLTVAIGSSGATSRYQCGTKRNSVSMSYKTDLESLTSFWSKHYDPRFQPMGLTLTATPCRW